MDEKNSAPAHHEVEAETARGIYEAVRPRGMLSHAVTDLGRIADGIERVGRELARGVDALERVCEAVQVGGMVGLMTRIMHPAPDAPHAPPSPDAPAGSSTPCAAPPSPARTRPSPPCCPR